MAITLTPPTTSQPMHEPTSHPVVGGLPTPTAARPAALEIEHLTKRFEVGGRKKRKTVVAVNDVSLRIERGEIYGLLGDNGSGKSTFIRLVSTLLTVEHGHVAVFGHDIVRD
jgi:ABC-type multidrug transport system ATPase subunit